MIKTRDLMLKLALMALLIFGAQSAHAESLLIGYRAAVTAFSQFIVVGNPPEPKIVPVFEITFDLCEEKRNAAIKDLKDSNFDVIDDGECKEHYLRLPDEFEEFLAVNDCPPCPYELTDENILTINETRKLMEKYDIRGYNEALQDLNHEFDIEGFKSELQREIKATGR